VSGVDTSQNKITGNWRAIVRDNLDPYKSGRVKIDIIPLGLKNMWAEPACQVGGSDVHGSYIIPRVGDKVFVFFDGNNINHPIYFATSPSQKDIPKAFSGEVDPVIKTRNSSVMVTPKFSEPTTNASVEYPYGQGVKFPGGVLLIVDESSGKSKVAMYHPIGSYEEFAGDGTHVVRVAKDDYEIIIGKKFMYVGGSMTDMIMGNVDTTVMGNVTENIVGSMTDMIMGNVDTTVMGNVTENIVGNQSTTVVGALNILAATYSIASAFGYQKSDKTKSITVMTTPVETTSLVSLSFMAPIITFTADIFTFVAREVLNFVAPIVNITGDLVTIGSGPVKAQAPILTALTAFCPWCGGKVGPGLPTVTAG